MTEARLPLHDRIDAPARLGPIADGRPTCRRPAPLARLAEANNLAGAYLDIDAIPLPKLRLGVGTARAAAGALVQPAAPDEDVGCR